MLGDEKYEKLLEYNRNLRRNNTARYNSYSCKKNLKAKLRTFELFGSMCKRCGFTDHRAPQIDHINGVPDGLRRVKNNPHRGGIKLYREILAGRFPVTDFQLLCANCNWIKRFENKEYNKYPFKKEN